jgi:hypothetical protein
MLKEVNMMKKAIVIVLAVLFAAASLFAAEAVVTTPTTITAAPVTMTAEAPVVKESFLKRLWHKLFPAKTAAAAEAAGNTEAPVATTATAK